MDTVQQNAVSEVLRMVRSDKVSLEDLSIASEYRSLFDCESCVISKFFRTKLYESGEQKMFGAKIAASILQSVLQMLCRKRDNGEGFILDFETLRSALQFESLIDLAFNSSEPEDVKAPCRDYFLGIPSFKVEHIVKGQYDERVQENFEYTSGVWEKVIDTLDAFASSIFCAELKTDKTDKPKYAYILYPKTIICLDMEDSHGC